MTYTAADDRYDHLEYRFTGTSGLKLPVLSLGLWQNFGTDRPEETQRAILRRAFDRGVTHFDLANNYGPPEGAAEETLGRILREDLGRWRDELIISTKAGYYMWPGPYGEWGSRKSLLASLDQSLRRLRLEYVDIFYSHRFDPETPLEETMGALAHAVRSGKALYAGISNYPAAETVRAAALLRELGTPCLVHQPRYSMLDRQVEQGLLATLEQEGIGAAVFSPLAKGLLTNRYFSGIPDDARARRDPRFLTPAQVTEDAVARARRLDAIARRRGQSLAQMALAWVLRHPVVTTAIIGASRVSQLEDCAGAARLLGFAPEELEEIETVLKG